MKRNERFIYLADLAVGVGRAQITIATWYIIHISSREDTLHGELGYIGLEIVKVSPSTYGSG